MSTQVKDYSVGQLARISGFSVRTLHHYDAIGLLKPAHTAPNGYRKYGRAELLRLQEILFYRAIDMPLADIASVLDGPDDAVARLTRHRQKLAVEVRRATAMLETLDKTIAHLKGKQTMSDQDLYRPFPKEKQAGYEKWLVENGGPDMEQRIKASKAAIARMPDGLDGAMERLRDIETRLVAAQAAGVPAQSPDLAGALEDHRHLIGRFWGTECTAEGFAGLADLYSSHPDFVARYERLGKGFSEWLPVAMKAHAERLTQSRG